MVTYDVVISVDNSDQKLKPGMTANVSIIVGNRENVLKIPNAALRFLPEDAALDLAGRSAPQIWILNKDKPLALEVKTGIDDYSYTELLSGNLKEGQAVIVGQQKKKK